MDQIPADTPTNAAILKKANEVKEKAAEAAVIEGAGPGDSAPQVTPAILDHYDYIVDEFTPFTYSHPIKLRAAAEHLLTAVSGTGETSPINKFNKDVSNAGDALNNWDSDAANAFRENFLNAYPDMSDSQVGLINELADTAFTYAMLMAGSRSDAVAIGDKTIESLQAIIDGHNADALSLTLTTLTVGLGAMGTVANATTTSVRATSWLAINSAASITASTIKIGGETVKEVISSMKTAFSDLLDDISNGESEIITVLDGDQEIVDANLAASPEDNALEAPRPSFTDNPGVF